MCPPLAKVRRDTFIGNLMKIACNWKVIISQETIDVIKMMDAGQTKQHSVNFYPITKDEGRDDYFGQLSYCELGYIMGQ